MSRQTRWMISNAVFLGALILGYGVGIRFFEILVAAMVILGFLISLLTLHPQVRELLRQTPPPVSHEVDLTFDITMTVLMIVVGAYFLAAMYLVHTLLLHWGYFTPKHKGQPL